MVEKNYIYDQFQGINGVLTYPKTKIKVFDAYDYLLHGTNLTNVVLFVGTTKNDLSGSYFTYDGSLDEVTNYYEEVSANYNTVPNLIIDSIENEYVYWKAFFLQKIKVMLPIFIMIILAIIMNTCQLAFLNVEANAKKYALLRSSGSRNITLIVNEIVVSFILLLLAETILYRFMNIAILDLIMLSSVCFVIDVIILWSVSSYKMRRFAERLR